MKAGSQKKNSEKMSDVVEIWFKMGFLSRESNDLWVEIEWHTFVYLFREKPSLLFTLSSLVRPFTLGTHETHTARGGFNKSWIHHPLFGYMIFTNMEKFCGFTVTKNSEFLRGPKKNGLRKQHWLNIPLDILRLYLILGPITPGTLESNLSQSRRISVLNQSMK